MSSRHAASRPRDAQTMTTPAPHAPKRASWLPKKIHGWQVLLVFLVIFGIAVIATGGFGDDKPDPTPAERLCTLLQTGWSTGQIAVGDEWKEWPEAQSPISRGIEIAAAADRGGCGHLT